MAHSIDKVVDALSAISGEPVDYLFELIDQVAETPITPTRRKALQKPRIKGVSKRYMESLDEDAYEDLLEALETTHQST